MQLITCICIIDTNTTWENMLGRNKVDICGPAEIRWKEQGHFITTDNKSPPEYTILCPYQVYSGGKGARRQVQGGALAPPWILLFSFFYRTIFMHRVWHRDWRCRFQSLLQSEIREHVLKFHKQTLDIFALQPLTSLWVCTPLEKILRVPMSGGDLLFIYLFIEY